MKKIVSRITLLVVSTATLGFADSSSQPTGATKTPFIEYHNRVALFDPFHQVYERIQPNAFYAGVESWCVVPIVGSKVRVLDAELRMGYNFFCLEKGRDHFTPFLGAGYFQDFGTCWFAHHRHRHHKPGIAYGTVGFLYDHEFTDIFNLGFNAKAIVGGPVSSKAFHWGSPVVGADVALPITFRFGHHRHWDFRIEPFNTYLHGSDAARNYFGLRNTLGYRF